MTATEMKKMNFKQRLQAMELLRDSLLEDEYRLESPPWHEDVLRERIKKMDNNEAKFISLDELKIGCRLIISDNKIILQNQQIVNIAE